MCLSIRNEKALLELDSGNELLAQSMLRENAKESPNCVTLNNLGVYYCQYGMIQKNGKPRNAKYIGMKYLLKASAYAKDWRNLVSVATAACECYDFSLAHYFFSAAYQEKPDDSIQFNLGACLYRLGNYIDALNVFSSLYDDTTNCVKSNVGQNAIIPMAYCYLALDNTLESIECIQKHPYSWEAEEIFDVFSIYYLCKRYECALSICSELLDEWYPTSTILAMIADCLHHAPTLADEIIIPDDKSKLFDLLRNDQALRKRIIEKYVYAPPLIELYQFI